MRDLATLAALGLVSLALALPLGHAIQHAGAVQAATLRDLPADCVEYWDRGGGEWQPHQDCVRRDDAALMPLGSSPQNPPATALTPNSH